MFVLPADAEHVGRRVRVAWSLALVIGFINGYLVVKTGMPSFLITLGTFFMLQGVNLGVTKLITGTVATTERLRTSTGSTRRQGALRLRRPASASSRSRSPCCGGCCSSPSASWILLRTQVGNWIFAVGGNADTARAVGVPVNKVKIGLFMGVSGSWPGSSACTCCSLQHACRPARASATSSSTSSPRSSAAACSPAATARRRRRDRRVHLRHDHQGIVFAGWDPDWFKAFLGVDAAARGRWSTCTSRTTPPRRKA